MILTKNFYLEEFTRSQTATRRKRQIIPTQDDVCELRLLCETILQPIRSQRGEAIKISSGLRPSWLNEAIGGARNSAHITGRAADFRELNSEVVNTFNWIRKSNIEFDKVILEYGKWIHIQRPKKGKEARRLAYVSEVENGILTYKRVTQ